MPKRDSLWCDACHNTGEIDCLCGGDVCVCGADTLPCPICDRWDIEQDAGDDE